MVQRLENSVALRISRGCMQEVRTFPVAAWISVGPNLCAAWGRTVLCTKGDAMMPSVSSFRRLFILVRSL